MLERASSSAECTAHLFLRHFDRPVRSRRVLNSKFWHYGGDEFSNPTWWPIYLQNLREKPESAPIIPGRVTSVVRPRTTRQGSNLKDGYVASNSSSKTKYLRYAADLSRSYSHLPNRRQQAPAPALAITSSNAAVEAAHEVTFTAHGLSTRYSQDEHTPPPPQSAIEDGDLNELKPNQNPNLISSKREKAVTGYDPTWRLFIESGQKHSLASHVLHMLSHSRAARDRRHALTAFAYIPISKRTQTDYEVIIRIARDLRHHRLAIKYLKETLDHAWGEQLLCGFAAYCIQENLWNTIAKLWIDIPAFGRRLINAKAWLSAESRHVFARLLRDSVDLPKKLLQLSLRLETRDAVLAVRHSILIDFCRRLAQFALGQQEVVASITSEELFTLFSIEEHLQCRTGLHLAAIGSIMRMRNRGSKSELALLVYRNLRFRHFDDVVPAWVFGAMIGICKDGSEPAVVVEGLLNDFREQVGQPDMFAYRKSLEACASLGEIEAVHRIFEQFRQAGGPKDVYDVNPLIHVYAVNGDTKGARAQFDRIKDEFHFVADVGNWSTLLLAHARSHYPDSVFEVFREMQSAKVEPNAFTWSILMSAAARRGDTSLVQKLFDQADEGIRTKSVHMFASLVESYLRSGDAEQAQTLVSEATRQNRVERPIYLWNILIRHHVFMGDAQRITQLQKLMSAFQVKPDSMTYAAFMTALVVRGRTEDAMRLIQRLSSTPEVNVTELHYSILIYGFVREGKRDKASTLYHELAERHPRLTPSAKLSLLHLHFQRDSDQNQSSRSSASDSLHPSYRDSERKQLRPSRTFNYLAQSVLAAPERSVTSPAHPGFDRKNPREGLSIMFLQSLGRLLQQSASFDQSKLILQQIDRLAEEVQTEDRTGHSLLTMKTNVLKLKQALEEQQWGQVRQHWQQVLAAALELSRPHSLQGNTEPKKQPNNLPKPHYSDGLHDMGSESNTFGDLVGGNLQQPSLSTSEASGILSSQRFILSRPLSMFLQALDYQNQHWEIVATVEDLQRRGFFLSSFNWNRYIQCLSKSEDFEHRAIAFRTFERLMVPNTPPWNVLVRGKWLPPSSAERDYSQMTSRQNLEKLQPDIPRPSYFTMIHLAAALRQSVQASSQPAGVLQTQKLQEIAPRTLKLVRATPYRRDRIQGVMLRGRHILGDLEARPRDHNSSHHLSVDVIRRPSLDIVPADMRREVEEILASDRNLSQFALGDRTASQNRENLQSSAQIDLASEAVRGSRAYPPQRPRHKLDRLHAQRIDNTSIPDLQSVLQLAEKVFGEIQRGHLYLTRQKRFENNGEKDRRVNAEALRKLKLLKRLQTEARESRASADDGGGDLSLATGSVNKGSDQSVSSIAKNSIAAVRLPAAAPAGHRSGTQHEPSSIKPSNLDLEESESRRRSRKDTSSDVALTKPGKNLRRKLETIHWYARSVNNALPSTRTSFLNRRIASSYQKRRTRKKPE